MDRVGERMEAASVRASAAGAGTPAGWSGLGRFSSDPMWYRVTLYSVGDALLVHRTGVGVIAETRRAAAGEVVVRDRRACIDLTLRDRDGRVGRMVLAPRTTAVAVLRTMGWVSGIASSAGSFRCRARTDSDGRPVRAFFDIGADELGLSVAGRPAIRLRRDRGATVDGEQTMRKVYLRLGDDTRTYAYVELGRRDRALTVLRRCGWLED
ncbi:MAG: hypothetical protein ACT4OX_03940 [Actinomycetota bacterium]